jgi:hypothetical protein
MIPQAEATPSTNPESISTGTTTIAPKEEPESGYVFSDWTLRLHTDYPDIETAELTVSTIGNNGYYIKLTRTDLLPDQNSFSFRFYVRGGDTVTVDVPLGCYTLSYATGSVWRGTQYLFGVSGVDGETRYYKADDIFEFYADESYTYGWTVELYEQQNGNLSTTEINENEF